RPGRYINLTPEQAKTMAPLQPQPKDDTGERLVVGPEGQVGEIRNWGGLTNEQQKKVIDALTRDEAGQPLRNPYRVDKVDADSPQKLQEKLQKLSDRGGFPLSLG